MSAKHGTLRYGWLAVGALAFLAATAWCGTAVAGEKAEAAVRTVKEAPAERSAGRRPEMPKPEDEAVLSEEERPSAKAKSEKTKSGKEKSGKAKADEAKPAEEKSAEAQEKPFNIDELIERLKKTDAIGFLTKLTLRSDALDLVDMIKAYKLRKSPYSLAELHAKFNGLLLKVLALLSDDPKLSKEISLARKDIWKSLMEVKA